MVAFNSAEQMEDEMRRRQRGLLDARLSALQSDTMRPRVGPDIEAQPIEPMVMPPMDNSPGLLESAIGAGSTPHLSAGCNS